MGTSNIRIDQLSRNEQAVLRVLLQARGRENAVLVPAVAEATDLPVREARKTVKALIEVHKIPIGSSMSDPAGWYLCVTADEAAMNQRAFQRRALSVLRRSRAFHPAHSVIVAQMLGQVFADFDGVDHG